MATLSSVRNWLTSGSRFVTVAFRFLLTHFVVSVWPPESGGEVAGGAALCSVWRGLRLSASLPPSDGFRHQWTGLEFSTKTIYLMFYLISFMDVWKYMHILNLMPATRFKKVGTGGKRGSKKHLLVVFHR